MPIYQYQCPYCAKIYEKMRAIKDRYVPVKCKACAKAPLIVFKDCQLIMSAGAFSVKGFNAANNYSGNATKKG